MNLLALPVVIGHKPPLTRLWGKFKWASYDKDGDGYLQLPHFSIRAGIGDKEIGEYHFLFGLRRYLESNQGKYGVVIISHYRRVLSSKKIGVPTNLNQSHTSVISPKELEREDVSIVLPKSGAWLIGTPVLIHDGKQLHHFNISHPLQEYLTFLTLAIDLQIINGNEAVALLTATHMITAASIGVFPIEHFVDHMTQLEALTTAYLDLGRKKYEGFNQRIIAFCLERIHSFLLMKVLERHGSDKSITGYQLVISENGLIRPSGL
jgi:hypothetical protein